MPYVPSEKTDGKSQDRNIIDKAVEVIAHEIAKNVIGNFEVLQAYKMFFNILATDLQGLANGWATRFGPIQRDPHPLAVAIWETGAVYGYEGAFLGEMNYALTRFIQRVPQIKVELGQYAAKDELRYWLYAVTVQALTHSATMFADSEIALGGVFEDIKDEYKRRVNTSYEAAQIIKSGDCYDTPYYTRLVEIITPNGQHVGHVEVMLKRSDETLHKDVLDLKLLLSADLESQAVAISDASGYTE